MEGNGDERMCDMGLLIYMVRPQKKGINGGPCYITFSCSSPLQNLDKWESNKI